MPPLLARYILGDFLRIFLLTTGVLVTVISFGAAIKPLTDESLLSFAQAAKYIGLAIVPMMQFALPFAAGFAATMTLHRMASDNEIVAMATSGISYRRILAPVAAMGIGLTVLMLALTLWIIPRFWALMAETLTTDLTRVFEASIRSGRAFELDDVQIYADRLIVDDRPPDSDAETRLTLYGVAAAEIGDDGEIVTDVTASEARVDVHRVRGRTLLKLVLYDTVAFNHRSGELVSTPRIVPTRPFVVPRIIEDEPVAMTRGQLRHMGENPDDFGRVARARSELAELLRDRAVWEELDGRLAADGAVELLDLGPEPRRYRIRAARITNGRIRAGGGPIEVEHLVDGVPVRRIRAEQARLDRGAAATLGGLSFDLTLEGCEVIDLAGAGAANRRQKLTFFNLAPPDAEANAMLERSSAELLDVVAALDRPDGRLEQAASHLTARLTSLRHAITGELQYRYALSAMAAIIVVLGAVLAIWLREALPLTVYLLSFTPAVAVLILVSGGMWMTVDGQPAGIVMTWSGNIGMLVILLFAYRRLTRH